MYPTCFFKGKIRILFLVLPFLFSCTTSLWLGNSPAEVQKYKPEKLAVFPSVINETSGLEYFANRFWTFNDSGGEALLYAFSPDVPGLDLGFYFTGLTNRDWEDICSDGNNLYIADIGNNFGYRDTLVIYKTALYDFLEGVNNYDTILFSFAEKESGSVFHRENPFDCEAVVIVNDSLWLFTKNWKDNSSSIYKIPANPGYYRPQASCTLQPRMLVTGADTDLENQKLWLIGYRNMLPVIMRYSIEGNLPVEELRIEMKAYKGLQVEAICLGPDSEIYFSNESSILFQAFWKLKAKW